LIQKLQEKLVTPVVFQVIRAYCSAADETVFVRFIAPVPTMPVTEVGAFAPVVIVTVPGIVPPVCDEFAGTVSNGI